MQPKVLLMNFLYGWKNGRVCVMNGTYLRITQTDSIKIKHNQKRVKYVRGNAKTDRIKGL